MLGASADMLPLRCCWAHTGRTGGAWFSKPLPGLCCTHVLLARRDIVRLACHLLTKVLQTVLARAAVRAGKPLRIDLWPVPVDLVLVSDPAQIQAMKADPAFARLHTIPTSALLGCTPDQASRAATHQPLWEAPYLGEPVFLSVGASQAVEQKRAALLWR